jgi:hypothetical protein
MCVDSGNLMIKCSAAVIDCTVASPTWSPTTVASSPSFSARALRQPEVIAEIVVGILHAQPQLGASAFHDMAAWVLLSLAVVISRSGGHLPLRRGMRLRPDARREAAHAWRRVVGVRYAPGV